MRGLQFSALQGESIGLPPCRRFKAFQRISLKSTVSSMSPSIKRGDVSVYLFMLFSYSIEKHCAIEVNATILSRPLLVSPSL